MKITEALYENVSSSVSSKKTFQTQQGSVLNGLFPFESRSSLWPSSPINVHGHCLCQPTGSVLSPWNGQVLPGLPSVFLELCFTLAVIATV